jgi:hypothetical protein
MRKTLLILALVPFLITVAALGAERSPLLRDGDIIFQSSCSRQSVAIEQATHSPYSHMGIIFIRHGEPYVYEAIGPVQYTPVSRWIARGDGGHYVVKRLKDADRLLTPATVARLRRVAESFRGAPYDLTFEWSDKRIYCSELVWKIYERGVGLRIGELQRLRDFNLSSPLVQAVMKERYGEKIPLEETVVSPAAIFAYQGLVVVTRK